MSLEVLTQGGGVGGASASIFVTGLSEADTVTAVKDGKTVNGKWTGVQYPVNPVFADNTWSQIILACQKNEVPDTWLVGDQKAMTIGGTDYLVDIIGKHHDTYADGSGTAPLTFQLHDCYSTTYPMNNSATNEGGWAACKMRNIHLPAILALMPTEVQAGIREVNKLTSEGNQSTTIITTADKLFLLSEMEVVGRNWTSVAGEGTRYAYYANGGTIKKEGNSFVWLRSPYANGAGIFSGLHNGASSYSGANGACGVAFAFCFGGEPIPYGHTIKIKEYGMWTVTATNGDKTATQNVLVDAAVGYEIEMDYLLWLYRDGDECEDVTGGWSHDGWSFSEASGYPNNKWEVKNADSISVASTATSGLSIIGTQQPVSTTGYNKLCCLVDCIVACNYGWCIGCGAEYSMKFSAQTGSTFGVSGVVIGNDIVLEADISDATAPLYFFLESGGGSKWTAKRVWLE